MKLNNFADKKEILALFESGILSMCILFSTCEVAGTLSLTTQFMEKRERFLLFSYSPSYKDNVFICMF